MATIVGVLLLALYSTTVFANPEQGKWTYKVDEIHQAVGVSKHMYKNSKVAVSATIHCEKSDELEIKWELRMSPCGLDFIFIYEESLEKEKFLLSTIGHYEHSLEFQRGEFISNCSQAPVSFNFEGNIDQTIHVIHSKNGTAAPLASHAAKVEQLHKDAELDTKKVLTDRSDTLNSDHGQQDQTGSSLSDKQAPSSRVKRDGTDIHPATITADTTAAPTKPTTALKGTLDPHQIDHQILTRTWVDGNYLLIITFVPSKQDSNLKADVNIRMFFGDESYISALDYPLLIFYGVLGLVYIVYGLVWLVLLACNWRDLLRVQFWIGGVILLGMMEKAVFFAEYENVNKYGVSVYGAVIFAELVSCMKRTLARMLVIIVSLGFGIVKPRLGQAFHKVLIVGGLFFILASIEGGMRATASKVDQSNQFLLATVPLAVLDAIICWWIFSSLIQTTRTLRLRRNVVKLTLYRHFTNTLIFSVMASIGYMVWSLTQHKFKECITDWQQLWIDEAFWHLLFVVLLLIIMLLWRPTVNNQRYAFSPLLDAADEEEDEDNLMNDAFDGMKMRGAKASNGAPKHKDQKKNMEDDLKWVEENIPSSVADRALPTLLDSDEELMTTKFEMSKME